MAQVLVNIRKKVSREHRIPFDVSVDPFFSERNMAAIDESAKQIKQGKVVIKTLDELEVFSNE